MHAQKETDKEPKKKRILGRFVRWFLIVAIFFVAVTAAFLYFNLFLSSGSGPAGPNVPIEPFRHVWSEQDVLLLGMGDSITVGLGAPKGLSYFDRLLKSPQEDCEDMAGKNLSAVFGKLKVRNIAVSGSVSSHHARIIKELEKQPAGVLGIIVMTSGGNDLIHNYGRSPPQEFAMYGATIEQARPWIDNFEKRLDEMMVEIKKKFPGGCHIFLANIYDPSDGSGDTNICSLGLPDWPDGTSILKAYNDIIAQCADRHDNVHLVNIHDAFLGHGIHCKKFWREHYRSSDPNYWYYYLVEEPNERGHDAIRRLFLTKISKVFYHEKSAGPLNRRTGDF